MTSYWRVTIDDDADLGFALDCLISKAITIGEFKGWTRKVLEDSDDAPGFLRELGALDYRHEVIVQWPHIVGFWPSWEPCRTEDKAISGIAYARFPDHHADDVTRSAALATLRKSHKLYARFNDFFPTAKVPELV